MLMWSEYSFNAIFTRQILTEAAGNCLDFWSKVPNLSLTVAPTNLWDFATAPNKTQPNRKYSAFHELISQTKHHVWVILFGPQPHRPGQQAAGHAWSRLSNSKRWTTNRCSPNKNQTAVLVFYVQVLKLHLRVNYMNMSMFVCEMQQSDNIMEQKWYQTTS